MNSSNIAIAADSGDSLLLDSGPSERSMSYCTDCDTPIGRRYVGLLSWVPGG